VGIGEGGEEIIVGVGVGGNVEFETCLPYSESLERDKSKDFTCLDFSGIPTTNNTAERILRPLVIKSKLTFWSKTSNWASMMEVIFSVVFSFLAKNIDNFFEQYLQLAS